MDNMDKIKKELLSIGQNETLMKENAILRMAIIRMAML